MSSGLDVGRVGEHYDVFLAHGSGDKALVKELYDALVSKGYSVFLDSEELVIGEVWRTALEDALSASRCIAFCVGSSGPGPWTRLELDFALRRERQDPSYPVIPVILRGGDFRQVEELSRFLPGYQGVSLTSEVLGGAAFSELTDMVDQALVSTGRKPRSARQLPIGDVQQSLRRLQARFSTSLRPFLAGGQEIERQETGEILRLLEEKDTRIVVVHGAAGSGKSGVLLLLADKLVEEGRPVLPIRLDRHPLRGTSDRFAATELNLPGPPGDCLASVGTSGRGALLLLDQLDALRWTGAHSSEAWDVCREMILDCLAASPTTKVVVCCRTFDLQHDPQLRSWKEQTRNLIEVRVSHLSEEQVLAAVGRAAAAKGEARPIEPRELDLLRHIHHLQMWLSLYPRLGSEGSLGTRRALMEAFWQDRRTRLTEFGMLPDRIEAIEARLVDAMRDGARLTAPLGMLCLSSRESEAYRSLHILQVDQARNRVSFCHQSYLDYLVALRIVGELEDSTTSLLSWLGARQDQSLFRREQLRLALEELRDRNAIAYINELRSLLDSGEDVRFHLRLLCLQFLSQLNEPLPSEKELVLNLAANTYWLEHVLGEVVRAQPPWFEAFDEAGLLDNWLASNDSKRRDLALEMLLSVVEARGDRVARLLRPYLRSGAAWHQRILWVLRFDPTKDTDCLFDLRIELTNQRIYTGDHIAWGELAAREPLRFLSLACHLLAALAHDILTGQQRQRADRRDEIDWHSFENVTPALLPANLRPLAWNLLFRSVMFVARIRRYQSEEDHVLESLAVEFETVEPIVGLLRNLGRTLLQEDWHTFTSLGEHLASGERRSEILFLDCLREGPPLRELADWVLAWLMQDPWRAQLRIRQGAGRWSVSSRVIDRYAPTCSAATLLQLEEWLLAYREPDLVDQYCRRHARIQGSGDFSFHSAFGRTPHALLPRLPPDRVSASVRRRIAELNRKFGDPAAWMYAESEPEMAGFVGSPLGHHGLERISDRALLELAASVKLGQSGRQWRWKGGHFEEASVESIASDFRAATQANPERFGNLLTRWPEAGYSAFVEAILSGLASPGDHAPPAAKTLKAPPHTLLEKTLSLQLVRHLATSAKDDRIARNLCNVLQRYAEYPWSDEAVDFVAWVARYHEHPGPADFPLGSLHDDESGFDRLESKSLNVTRGGAGYACRELLFQHPGFLVRLRSALESLIDDPHPAVKVAGIAACIPVLNIDKDLAVDWFLTAVRGPDQILATGPAEAFLRYSYRTHHDQLLPIFDRMLVSPLPRAMVSGAKWIAAVNLVEGAAEERFERCIAGTPLQRQGVARAAASLFGVGEYAEKAKQVLLQLADDFEEDVARVVAGGFRHLDLRHITTDREAWNRFARSKAFQTDPTPLLRALEQQSGDLLPFAECLLLAGTTFAEELAELALDHGRGLAGDAAYYLLPLLLRLYEQSMAHDRATYLSCLDLWDRLLERRVGSAMGLTRELDRM